MYLNIFWLEIQVLINIRCRKVLLKFIIYRKWLSYLLPQLKRVQYHDQVNENNYYISNAHGNARMIHDGIPNAVEKMSISRLRFIDTTASSYKAS